MAEERDSHVFGPVPSRRLGRSLGVDLVPFKVCSFDCIYCQLGATTNQTVERRDWVPVDEIIEDVRAALAAGATPDHITLSGSGEPTLHVYLDEIIRRVKKRSDVPVALLTNGSLFHREDVRRDAALADVVLPSLDAPDAGLFARINRPHESIPFERYVDGLAQFREEYAGPIRLEVFVLKGLNDSDDHADRLAAHLERIRPDRIELNTAVRPTAEAEALRVSPGDLARLCGRLGPTASVVADFDGVHRAADFAATREHVLGMLRRRPCTARDVAAGLGLHRNEVLKHLSQLLAEQSVRTDTRGADTYYRASR